MDPVGGEGEGGTNWECEISIDIYTSMCEIGS